MSQGFSFDIWIDPPGQRWIDFVHKQDELVVVIEGQLSCRVGEKHYVLNVGDEVFIPAGESHDVITLSDGSRWAYGYRTL